MVADDALVQAGGPLSSIDARAFGQTVKQAEANLTTAGEGINTSTASLVAAPATVTRAHTRLERALTDGDGTFPLEKSGSVLRSQGAAARARVAHARVQVSSANADLQSARVAGSQGCRQADGHRPAAKLESASYDRASTVVKAPHYGVVTHATLSPGQFIGAGNPAMTFFEAHVAWITVDVRENQWQDVTPGDPAHLLFDASPGTIFEGRVQSIAWGISPGRSADRGLGANQASNRWFEPARRNPVRIELEGGMQHWPRNACGRQGGCRGFCGRHVQSDGADGARVAAGQIVGQLPLWASYRY